jgi:uncharacterized protein YndB with AHSA1/START domain
MQSERDDGGTEMAVRESVNAQISSSPEKVFDLISDPRRLPVWNHAITEVVEAPGHLEPGSVWKVRLHALSQSWVSTSQASVIDPVSGLFAYRSQTDDGNPSYADWEWRVQPNQQGGSTVTVTVELHPTTFLRKHILIRIRRPALRREMRESLRALGEAAGS